MRRAVLALSAALCLAAVLAKPEGTPKKVEAAAVDPGHQDEISFLRSRFKEDVGVDVQDDDLHHLLEGAARFAMSADALEDELAPPYPFDSVKAQADVDDEPADHPLSSAQ